MDVRRKPPGLSALLKAERSVRVTNEMLSSLGKRGFYLDPDTGALLSSEGEVHCQMKDGAQQLGKVFMFQQIRVRQQAQQKGLLANEQFLQLLQSARGGLQGVSILAQQRADLGKVLLRPVGVDQKLLADGAHFRIEG